MAPVRRPLITERTVRAAARDGQRMLDARGALVTPSAAEAAKALGVTLQGLVKPEGRTSKTRTVHAAPAAAAPTEARVPSPTVKKGAAGPRRIALGADHGGVAMKDVILAALRERGLEVEDLGTFGSEPVDYPDYAAAVARAVAGGRADAGIMIDGAGIGSCMAANRVPGVRAAMCHDVTTALNAREHNDANVLTLGGTLLGPRLALEIVTTFLGTPFGGGRHQRRVDKIMALEADARDAREARAT